jgi:NAD(P)-dependent dehydrogenase (short-subunit alcohol dehydrogenase family)
MRANESKAFEARLRAAPHSMDHRPPGSAIADVIALPDDPLDGARLHGRPSYGGPARNSRQRAGASRVCATPVDLTCPESVAGLFGAVANRFGRLDLLVDNAGAHGAWQPVDEVSRDARGHGDRDESDGGVPARARRSG